MKMTTGNDERNIEILYTIVIYDSNMKYDNYDKKTKAILYADYVDIWPNIHEDATSDQMHI